MEEVKIEEEILDSAEVEVPVVEEEVKVSEEVEPAEEVVSDPNEG